MKCQKCKSEKVMRVKGKCSDLCIVTYPNGREKRGYVPEIPNVGGGDYVKIDVCLDCGQIQGKWPVEIEEPGLNEEDAREMADEVIEHYAEDMRDWKKQFVGRTLDDWKGLVKEFDSDLAEEDVEMVATACLHKANA